MVDADTIAELKRRLTALEDERAIQAVITRYALSVDTNNLGAMQALYAEDCVVDIDEMILATNRDETRVIIESDAHQGISPYCAHVMGPFVVELLGDERAAATGYASVFVREGSRPDGRPQVWRQAFGRWELRKVDGEWQIERRTSRSVGHAKARDLISRAL